jgi:hypothetical protein
MPETGPNHEIEKEQVEFMKNPHQEQYWEQR